MKPLLVLLLLLAAVPAYADPMPDGCYVAYSNPNYCWLSSDSSSQSWTYYPDFAEAVQHYGGAVAVVMLNGHQHYQNLQSCLETHEANKVIFDTVVAEKAKLEKKVKKLQKKVKKLQKQLKTLKKRR